ncbi:MAG: gamma-polyglutamate synthase [Candidatus Cloacimonadota bacterium]|nr:gamma-polyglutamate synthase [Candidatus Cloacimonadota bacterium]
MLGLILGLSILIGFGIYEYYSSRNYRRQIPTIIHVNGTRGKSSVTRLVAAGLRAAGYKVIAKTTGSAAILIYENGREAPIARYTAPNIKEQVNIIKFAARRQVDFLVLECMAVTPEYQWVVEHKIVNSDIGVITNSRLDHLDVMGPGLKNVTLSLCNTIPKQGKLFTAEKKTLPLLEKVAKDRKTKVKAVDNSTVSDELINKFSYIEHKDNVALALAVCQELGVKQEQALRGMYAMQADVGAAEIFPIKIGEKPAYFAHSFAANDPESTFILIDIILQRYKDIKDIILVLNTREDRIFRSKQIVDSLLDFDFAELILIGQQVKTIEKYAIRKGLNKKISSLGWVSGDQLENYLQNNIKERSLIFGIGNIGGNGGEILEYFKVRTR